MKKFIWWFISTSYTRFHSQKSLPWLRNHRAVIAFSVHVSVHRKSNLKWQTRNTCCLDDMSNITCSWLPFSLGWLLYWLFFILSPLALTVHSLSFFRIRSVAPGIFLVGLHHREAPYSLFLSISFTLVFLRLLGHWNSQCSSITNEVTRNLSQKWEQDRHISVLPVFATCDWDIMSISSSEVERRMVNSYFFPLKGGN